MRSSTGWDDTGDPNDGTDKHRRAQQDPLVVDGDHRMPGTH